MPTPVASSPSLLPDAPTYHLTDDWLVWYSLADYLNWTACLTLPEAIAEARHWDDQGLEAGIQGASGDAFQPPDYDRPFPLP